MPLAWAHGLLLGLLLTFPKHSFQSSITDATSTFVPSSESMYDHMVELEDNLWLHWSNHIGEDILILRGRLVHTADSEEQAPSWLGFGINHVNKGYKASDPFMVGSTAVIGAVFEAERVTPAQQYQLVAQSTDGIKLLESDDDGDLLYSDSSIMQHERDDGKIITDLSFTIQDTGDMGENLRIDGVNVFIWAVGPVAGKSTASLGKHSMKGVIFLDLLAVQGSTKGPATPSGTTPNSDKSTEKSILFIRGQCGSKILGEDSGYVVLKENIEFHWNLLGRGTMLQVALSYTGDDAWLGVAISTDGRMVGSSAVIASVDGIHPTHYNLTDRDIGGVTADHSLMLKDASITAHTSPGDSSKVTTILQYTKQIDDPNDSLTITSGMTTFLYAVGASRELAYHEHRGAFQVNLEDCGGNIVARGTWTRAGIFAAHGFFALLAWALVAPFAVSVAFFRTLVPTAWIYIHVFANVVTFLTTLVAFTAVVVAVSNEDAAEHFSKTHHWIGLILLLLATFQVTNGLLRPPVQRKHSNQVESPHATILGCLFIPRTPRETWQLIHRLSGWASILMGVYQIHSGLNLYSLQFSTPSKVKWFWIYIGILSVGLVTLKIWSRMTESKRQGFMHPVSTSDIDDDREDRETEMSTQLPPDILNTATLS